MAGLGFGRRWLGDGAQREARARFKESRAGIAALGSGKGIPAGSPVISGAR